MPRDRTKHKTLKQVEAERGISRNLQRAAIRAGELDAVCPGKRTYYVTDLAIDRWLRRRRVPASPRLEARAEAVAKRIAKRMRT